MMANDRYQELEQRLWEGWQELFDRAVDPREAWDDGDGGWRLLGMAGSTAGPGDEGQLAALREECRHLALANEFAINGHENRISYIVGTGHTYRAVPRKGFASAAALRLAAEVQTILERFLIDNHWQRRQAEIVRRRDRDGEVFLRFFPAADGGLKIRFVEPDQVRTPAEALADESAALGIVTARHDVETVHGYFVDGAFVPADDMQHRKANVDGNVKRGLPLFAPVRKNLRRAEKLLRNMSVVAEIQSAIALIRRHQRGGRNLEQWAAQTADATVASAASGKTTHYRRYAPGTILDVQGNVEYDFPAAGLDAGRYVTVLQAELRAIASRLVMPEFMLTSDASNANYASTMVAEGPAMRSFARLQAEQMADDLAVLRRVVATAVRAGTLPAEAVAAIEITASPPSLAFRDPLAEVQAYRIEHAAGILSPQTWCQRRGLDYDQEQANLAAHAGGIPRRAAVLVVKGSGQVATEVFFGFSQRFGGQGRRSSEPGSGSPAAGGPP